MKYLGLFVFLLTVSTSWGLDHRAGSGYTEATVYYANGAYSVQTGIDESGVAYGSFNDTLQVNGWGILKIATNSDYPDQNQMYAAGYLEGYLTSERIYDHYLNMYQTFFQNGTGPSQKLLNFVDEQDKWTRSQIAGDINNLPDYWQQVAFIVAHFDGLVAGYQIGSPRKPLDLFAFQLLNGVGDFLDLIPALQAEMRVNWFELTRKEFFQKLARNGHCSAIVKVNGDLSDLWAAHSSWFVYSATNRIYKHYNFDLKAPFVSAKKMSFSSYPGFLESLDDFYIMDTGLTMVQTTNSILNSSLYQFVTPYALWAWQRVRLSNSMANSGQQWGALFSQHNSGTYNNQYMVVDYKRFQIHQQILDGTLYVVEQIPGLVLYADVTDQLERGYWASYNVPYFPEIYNLSGYPAAVQQYGWDSSYQMAPRAKIFRRDQTTVVDLDSLKAIMRYNNYKNDPYSEGDPGNAICSRFDLEPENPSPVGCYDTKVTSYALQAKMVSHALNGPTTSHGIPPFQWTAEFNGTDVVGLPNVYDFDFVVMDPEWD